MLSVVIADVGQLIVEMLFRAQMIRSGLELDSGSHPQRRTFSKPLFLHSSHFHAAWFAN